MQPPINNQTTNPGMPPSGQPPQNIVGAPPAAPQQGGMGQSPWSTPPPIAPPNTGAGNAGETGYSPGSAQWQAQGYGAGTEFGGQGTTGAQAGAADYEGVRGFADQAYEQARRNIDPMQEQQGRRMEQDLINKGIDPSSPQGIAMLDQQNRNFADQDNSANFAALQFGQGIQDQMFGQDFMNTKQAGDMQQGMWNNERNQQNVYGQKYGNELGAEVGWGNVGLGYNNADVARYRGDQDYSLGQMNNEVNRQQQDWSEFVGHENMQYRDDLFNQNQQNWQDQFAANLMTGQPAPTGAQFDVNNRYAPWGGVANNNFGIG